MSTRVLDWLVPPSLNPPLVNGDDGEAVRHRIRVGRVAEQLEERKKNGITGVVSLQKRSVSHVVPKRDDKRHTDQKIDISDLNHIISIDPRSRTCTAEPGVTFAEIVDATLEHGLVPTVVPEFKTITIGGAVTGCSIESMSFQHGGFHDSCLEYEVVTASGDVITCHRDGIGEELFEMMHGSFGTLGILTKLKFKLVPAKRFVKMRYETYTTCDAYRSAIQAHYDAQDVDFMDGMVFGPDKYVLSLGTFVDEAPYTNRYDLFKVYWKSTLNRVEDYLRTYDYLFRYDRGITHVTSYLGPLAASDYRLRAARALHRLLPKERPSVIVDVFIPLSEMSRFLSWCDQTIDHYPLWVVPYKRVRDYAWIEPELFSGIDDEMFVDIAIYGAKQPVGRNLYRELELALPRFHGLKTLISYNYYEPDEFWRTFNRKTYEAVKQRVDPDNIFRDLYSKTCRAAHGMD
jgi:FAD/FMN-containing dehydrogenase